MPRIPQVSPKVGVPSAPPVRQNISSHPSAFVARTPQALTRVGDVGQKIAAELQQRRNVVEVQNAYLAATQAMDEYLHHPETGVYNRRGVNAAGTFDEVRNRLPELASEFTANLSGVQRELFERQWNQAVVPAMRGAMNHESREITNEKAKTLQALVESNANRISLNYTDAEARKQFEDITKANIMALADLAGWSPQTREAYEEQVMSAAYAATFERFFAVDDIAGATEFLNSHGDKMNPAVVAKLRNELRAKERAIFVENNADAVFDMFPSDLEAGMRYIRDNFEGETRRDIERLYKSAYQVQVQADNHKRAVDIAEGFNAMVDAGNLAGSARVVNSITDPQVKAQLTKVQLQWERAERVAAGNNRVDKQQQAWAKNELYKHVRGLVHESREQFTDPADVASFAIMHGITDRSTINKLKRIAMGDGIYEYVNQDSIYNAIGDIIPNPTYQALGITPPPGILFTRRISAADVGEQFSSVIEFVADRLESELAPGVRPTRNQIREATALAMTEVVTERGRIWDTKMTLAEAVVQGKKPDLIRSMDTEERKNYGGILALMGIASNDENINNLAVDMLMGTSGSIPEDWANFFTWASRPNRTVRTELGTLRVTPEMLKDPAVIQLLKQDYEKRTRNKLRKVGR